MAKELCLLSIGLYLVVNWTCIDFPYYPNSCNLLSERKSSKSHLGADNPVGQSESVMSNLAAVGGDQDVEKQLRQQQQLIDVSSTTNQEEMQLLRQEMEKTADGNGENVDQV